jgi:RNA polymerase sigma-70 factor (ECF subfamily)
MIRSRKIQDRVEHLYLLDLDTTILPTECLDEELKALQQGIAQLDPPICQDIIIQHYRNGVTFKEIAIRQDVSETTVYKHLRRALNQLRTHLKNK